MAIIVPIISSAITNLKHLSLPGMRSLEQPPLKAPKGKPFFYVRNFMVTHESRIWMRKDIPLTVAPEK